MTTIVSFMPVYQGAPVALHLLKQDVAGAAAKVRALADAGGGRLRARARGRARGRGARRASR